MVSTATGPAEALVGEQAALDDEPIVDDSREPDVGDDRVKDTSFISVFREFFLSAFSDHYQDAYYCCGPGFMQQTSDCCSGRKGKVGPEQVTFASQISGSTSVYDLEKSASQDSARKRRKKPLAIAVGYKYAEDMDGRPVVITRKAPIDIKRTGSNRTAPRTKATAPSPNPSLSDREGSNDYRSPVPA